MPALLADRARLMRWLIAVGAAAVACALQWSVRSWTEPRIPFLFFLPAVFVAAALSGRTAGLFVAAAGLVNGLYGLAPAGSFAVQAFGDLLSLGLYALVALLLATFGARLRTSSARAFAAEQRLVLAVEATGIGVFDVDLVAHTAWLSPALATLVGLPATSESLPLATVMARLPPEQVRDSREFLVARLRQRARSYERELQIVLADRRPRWLLLRVQVAWSGERATRLRGACVDITERKAVGALLDRTQMELSEQVADLRRLHLLSSRLLETSSLEEQLQLILRAATDLHGARRGLVTLRAPGRQAMRIAAGIGFDAPTLAHLAAEAEAGGLAGGLACLRETHVVVADTEAPAPDGDDAAVDDDLGRLREFAREQHIRAVHGTPVIGPRGDVLGALTLHFDSPHEPSERERALADICARKAAIFVERARAEEALAETRGRFQAVLDASAVPFVVLSPLRDPPSARIVDFAWSYVNEAAARALRRAPAAFIGRSVLEVLPERWSSGETFREYVAVVETGATREFEARVQYEGSDTWYHCVASPMRGDVALWFTDVTERKLGEQALQQADRRKDEFLATLAHELRNPLAPIRQATAISRMPAATDAQKRWSLEVIERQVGHMALLLDDLLDVSRITRGALTLRRGRQELGAVLDAAVETARPLIDARRHALEIVAPSAPIELEVDPLRVSQVVANLLTNAAKYTDPQGRILLTAALDGDDVVIEVSDNGIGIAPESLPAVFDMFTQLRVGGDRAGGLGIGLALTKGLVELHGGRLEARSDGPGRGSVFTVRLPRGVGTGTAYLDAAPRTGRLEEPQTATLPPPELAPNGRRVLIADDNRDAAESLAALLELEGHRVALAFDGDEALRLFERFRPSVCLLDIGMPRRNGNDVARAIRARPDGGTPTLVAITGWGQETDRHQALVAGFDHHLTKPMDPTQLLRIIETGGPGPAVTGCQVDDLTPAFVSPLQ
jgi:signal transduction histidine kinase/ActR/RegA family two-component response regulator